MNKVSLYVIPAYLVSIAMIACGGGGGGGSSNHTVGGLVSGLSGTIVLRNNGTDDLTLTTNRAFEFQTSLANNTSYSVTIVSDPVLQNCSVTNGSGTMSGSNVTNVTVTCADKAWTHPASLADGISPSGQNAYYQKVAMAENGDAIIIWRQSDALNEQIFKSEYRAGAWTHPSSLTDNISPDGQDADDPKVAMDRSGNAIVVWTQFDGTNMQAFKSEYRAGAWTHPSSLSDNISPDGRDTRNPALAMADNGDAIIVWRQSDGSNDQIFKSEYRAGAWIHPASLADNISPDGQNAVLPQAAMDASGNTVVAWMQLDGAHYQVFKGEYRAGTWTLPSSLTDNISPDGQDIDDLAVAGDDDGNTLIVWRQSDGTNLQIFKSEYRTGAWTHPASLTDNISPDGQDAYDPRGAMDGNGNAIIVWRQFDGATSQIFKSEYRSNAWTHPSSLTDNISPDGQDSHSQFAAMDDNGNAIIVWMEHDGTSYQVFKSEFRNGTWTHPSSLADKISPDGPHAYYPQPAMDGDGNAIIVWFQSDSTDDRVYKSEFR